MTKVYIYLYSIYIYIYIYVYIYPSILTRSLSLSLAARRSEISSERWRGMASGEFPTRPELQTNQAKNQAYTLNPKSQTLKFSLNP